MSKNKMAPPPWIFTGHTENNWIYAENGVRDGGDIICIQPDMPNSCRRWPANAAAIIAAINGTYGCGVNPDSVKDMLAALEEVMQYFGDQLYTDSPTPKLVAAAIEKSKIF